MNSGDCVNIKLQLDNWRGLSAYEVALKKGYKGTEEEWLESLHGAGGVASVNGQTPNEAGKVQLTAENIHVSENDTRTLKQLSEKADELSSAITVKEDAIDLGGRYLLNARFL